MANQTKQQVADQLNKLTSQGASEQQILNYVNSAGYQPDDFNVDLNGSFRPMVVGTGTVTQNYTAAELAESNAFYENTAASSSTVTPKPTASITTTVTTTEITSFQQTTGGGTTTVYSTPSVPTATSQAYKAQADQSFSLAESYRLNPESKFGKAALDKRLADGRLSQEQYNQIVNSTPEQRAAQASVYSTQYEQARSNEIATQAGGQPVVEVTPAQNTSLVSVEYQKTVSIEDTKLTGAVAGTSVTTASVEGETYQVTTNENGLPVYTSADGVSVTGDYIEPLSEPPGVTADEFDGIDQQVADNESGLQEPPQLSDEEVNNYFDQLQAEQIENYGPADIEENVFDSGTTFNAGEESVFDPTGTGGAPRGLGAQKLDTNSQATQQDVSNFQQKEDWRVRLSLAPSANYLYKVPKGSAGILEPLQATDGVIFPYTPQIQVNYQANYDPTDLTHSNYKIFQYKNSGVDSISITCDFTAQDTYEANYLLAVIHFFRSVTKMFYGQDQNPKPGTPPPLCYLSGLGAFQFDAHPLAITSFNYSLPSDVDYIRAGAVTAGAGVNRSPSNTVDNSQNTSAIRLGPGIGVGGTGQGPVFSTPPGTVDPTYVPTKIQLSIGAVPVVTRNDISNRFSLKDYATGKLLRGSRNSGGGIW